MVTLSACESAVTPSVSPTTTAPFPAPTLTGQPDGGGPLEPSTVPSTTANRDASMVRTWTYAVHWDSGYVYGGKLEVGAIGRLTPGLSFGGLAAGSACNINPTTDGVIPGRLTATNLTKGFPARAYAEFFMEAGSALTAVEMGYASQPVCVQQRKTKVVQLKAAGEVGEGQFVQVPLFFVIAGYFTPAHPAGDPSVLAGVVIGFSGGMYDIEASGPAVVHRGQTQVSVRLGG